MTDELKSIITSLIEISESNLITPNSQYLRMKEKIKELKQCLMEEENK